MIPANEWWQIIQHYAAAVFPAQIILYVLALIMIFLVVKHPGERTTKIIKGYFILVFGWIAIVFFTLLGKDLPMHNMQTFLFASITLFFLLDLFSGTTQFRIPRKKRQRQTWIAAMVLVILAYPLVGFLLGRPTTAWIIPGTFPCPSTALALLFLSTSFPKKRRWIYIVNLALLLIWAIPFPIMIQIPKFGVSEDAIMLASGIYAIIIFVLTWQRQQQKA
jgi:hypothetical protein